MANELRDQIAEAIERCWLDWRTPDEAADAVVSLLGLTEERGDVCTCSYCERCEAPTPWRLPTEEPNDGVTQTDVLN